jgi:PKD repeat protein
MQSVRRTKHGKWHPIRECVNLAKLTFIPIPGANRINVYPLIRPIITTTVSPNWVSAKTSTTCGAPAVYNFTNTNTATTPSYNVHFMISPTLAISRSLNYGDGSSAVSFPNGSTKTNTYTQLGNFTAIYTETYYGWNANCAVSLNQPIVVDNPIPAFTYTTNGLTVTLNNSSANNLSGFVWSFGDLGTSTQQQPGSHTYSSPGTYVIELEANAPCGKVRYSVSVTVPSNSSGGATGIAEASNNGSAFISLSPNPSNAHITITNKGTQSLNGKIEIYNSLGACVKTIQEESLSQGQTTISIEALPAGVYFMKLHNQQGDVVKSFVKN